MEPTLRRAGRTHERMYSAEELYRLERYNAYVGLNLWLGIIGMLAVPTLANLILKHQGYHRRRRAGFNVHKKRPPQVRIDNPELREVSIRFAPSFLSACWRKYSIRRISIANLFNLGNIGQISLITTYVLLNLLLIFLGASGDIDWQAHHAARLVYANIPLVIGLAGKNNVISKMTGFAYESLNVLHRWSARFIIVMSAIHVGGRIYVNVPNVNPAVEGQRYVAWGWVAFAAFIYMIGMATRRLRNWAYQFFYHVALWFIIVGCLVLHRPQQQGWIWAGFVLHWIDRIARTFRIILYHGIRTVSKNGRPTGTVQALSDDTMLVSVRTRQDWIPAQHIYLHAPKESIGGHPFTVCNISRPLDQGNNARPAESTQELLIRVRGGATRQLYKKAISGGTGDEETVVGMTSKKRDPVPIEAWSEGPYGHEKFLGEDYDTLVLISAGSGVSYCLSNALDIVRRAKAMRADSGNGSIAVATKRLSFIWVVKKPEQVEWIAGHLKDMCLAAPPGLLHITIFITAKPQSTDQPVLEGFVTDDRRHPQQANDLSPFDEPTASTARIDHNAIVEVRSGRPDFGEMVERELSLTAYGDWVAVGACGPLSMNTSVADAVTDAIKPRQVLRGEVRRNIYLTIEEFGW